MFDAFSVVFSNFGDLPDISTITPFLHLFSLIRPTWVKIGC